MTKQSISPQQRWIVEICEALGFGVIERLWIHGGSPCCDPEPHIVQEIKLGSEPGRRPDRSNTDQTLQKEFAVLFLHLQRLCDGMVDIEVRHSVPFRLVMERRYTELVPKRPERHDMDSGDRN